jgi:hypothetical protein
MYRGRPGSVFAGGKLYSGLALAAQLARRAAGLIQQGGKEANPLGMILQFLPNFPIGRGASSASLGFAYGVGFAYDLLRCANPG